MNAEKALEKVRHFVSCIGSLRRKNDVTLLSRACIETIHLEEFRRGLMAQIIAVTFFSTDYNPHTDRSTF